MSFSLRVKRALVLCLLAAGVAAPLFVSERSVEVGQGHSVGVQIAGSVGSGNFGGGG